MGVFGRIARKLFSRQIKADIFETASQISGASISKIKAQVGISGNTVYHLASGERSGGAKYPGGISEAGGLVMDHHRIRLNARDAYADSSQAKAFVDRYADTVAGIGLVLEPAPKAELLGITPEEAEKWSRDVEERFDSWARSPGQHRAETMSWYQSHRLYQIFQHRDNDIFSRFYYSRDLNLLNPLQFSFVEPNQIRGDAYTGTFYDNSLQNDGITRDGRGRETGYKIWQRKSDGSYDYTDIPRIGPRSKRVMMLHGFSPDYAGQGRGYSRLFYALQEFANITDFTLATIKKAINQSQVAIYVKPSTDAPAGNPFEGIMSNKGAGPAADQFGATPTPASDAQNVSVNPITYYSMPEATMETPGSVGVFNLDSGEDLKPFEGKVASESFNTFVDAFCAYLCAAGSMPLEVLLMKFNQNYSASRGTLILFWQVVSVWREEMTTSYCNPTYEMWLSEEIAAGRVVCRGWMDPRMRAAWLNCRWIGMPMPNIDPEKTANADMKYVEMAAQTLDRVSRNFNGSSGKANRSKLKKEISELTTPPWSKNKDTAEKKTKEKKNDDDV